MPNNRDEELQREIDAHLELEMEERMEEGLSAGEARAAARRAFGNVLQAREDVQAVWTWTWLREARHDAMYGFRMLAKNPGFAFVAIVTLALGIGANTAIFSLVHAVLMRPLPFVEPDRLVVVWEDTTARGGTATSEATPGNFRDWKTENHVFDDMAALAGRMTFNLTGNGDPERLSGARVTGSLFSTLGLPPIAGRTIVPDDDQPGAEPVVVLSEGLWRRRFGADPAVVGRTITLDDVPRTVIGIVPGHFQFPEKGTDVWVPAAFTAEQLAARSLWYLYVVARLKKDVSLVQARDDLAAVAQRLAERFPQSNGRLGVTLVPLHDQYVRNSRLLLMVLLATVAAVLLIACVNVAHLLLARADVRSKEIAVRGALGASRGRVVRQLLAESLVLAGLAAVAGSVSSLVVFRFLGRLIPENFPESMTLDLNPAVLAFTSAVALLTSVAFGVVPALAASRVDVQTVLQRAGTRGNTARNRGLRSALIVGEVSLTFILLIAGALLLRSYTRLSDTNPGLRPQGLVVAETPLSSSRYGTMARRSDLVARVLERIEQQPGVVSAGYVNYAPMTFPGGRAGFAIEGRPAPTVDERRVAINRAISPGYLATLGVPLLRGRHIEQRDGPASPPVVVINETMARTFWGSGDPVGHRIKFGNLDSPTPWLLIIGVVGDVREIRLDLTPDPEFYVPLEQLPATVLPFAWPRYLVVRTSGDPSAAMADIRRVVTSVDADQPVANLRTMEGLVEEQLTGRGLQLTLVGAFSLLSLLLAAVGLYGVLSYGVAQQTSEIGLRMALGASRSSVVKALLRRTLILTGCGIAVGVIGAALATRALSTLLYEVSSTDPGAFAAVAVLLAVVAAAACIAPVRRATRIDPLAALRVE